MHSSLLFTSSLSALFNLRFNASSSISSLLLSCESYIEIMERSLGPKLKYDTLHSQDISCKKMEKKKKVKSVSENTAYAYLQVIAWRKLLYVYYLVYSNNIYLVPISLGNFQVFSETVDLLGSMTFLYGGMSWFCPVCICGLVQKVLVIIFFFHY